MQDLPLQTRVWIGRNPTDLMPVSPSRAMPLFVWPILAGVAVLGGIVLALLLRQPVCQSYRDKMPEIQRLVEQGKTDLAGGLAELYLSRNDACVQAEIALASLGYEAGMQEIYKHPEAGALAVDRWQELESKADQHHVPKSTRSPMTVFANSYGVGLFDLAAAAFTTAWRDRLVGSADRLMVSKYYASLFNAGVQRIGQGQEQTGLKLIATAAMISKAYGMTQGEARSFLRTRFGENEASWPEPDKADAVLNQNGGR